MRAGAPTNFFQLIVSRHLDAKEDRRVARLTLKQYSFWVRAFAGAIGRRFEEESSSLKEKFKTCDIAKQRAWERLCEQWPELRGKV